MEKWRKSIGDPLRFCRFAVSIKWLSLDSFSCLGKEIPSGQGRATPSHTWLHGPAKHEKSHRNVKSGIGINIIYLQYERFGQDLMSIILHTAQSINPTPI